MKKASYRVLQWTMLMGTAALMATACVVTSGDGDDDDSLFDGGEGGTSSTAGKTSTGGGGKGGSATAGTSSGGSSGSAGTATGGTTTGGTGGSSGGPAYVPGECQGGDLPTPLPQSSCEPADGDEDQPCRACQKEQCCFEWRTCYGNNPTSACGWGATEEADGQFDCIQHCYLDGLAEATNLMDLQRDCADECVNQCADEEADMGLVTDITQDLVACSNEKCLDECFPAE